MPSPFPGMDPYLEGTIWADVHTTLLVAIRDALTPQLPEELAAVVNQSVWMEASDGDGDEDRRFLGSPDVFVPRRVPPNGAAPASVPSGGGLLAPARTTLSSALRTGTRYLRITDREMRRVITVVELLSPANKNPSNDRPRYMAKRQEYLAAGVNLVEVDLLRAGERMPLGEPAPAEADYYYFVVRGASFPAADVWAFTVRDPFPPLVVPLEPVAADAVVDLGRCLNGIYDRAGYRKLVAYDRPPSPPLRRPDAEWAAEWLASRPQEGGA